MAIEQKPDVSVSINSNGILPIVADILPQKYPFLFIDKIIDINRDKTKIKCLKNVTINEYYFQGHFPGNPVVPGVIIIEAMAQASILLYASIKPGNIGKHPDYFLGKVDARFKKPVTAGDSLIIEIESEKVIDTGGIVKAVASVRGEIIAEATISFGVNIKHV